MPRWCRPAAGWSSPAASRLLPSYLRPVRPRAGRPAVFERGWSRCDGRCPRWAHTPVVGQGVGNVAGTSSTHFTSAFMFWCVGASVLPTPRQSRVATSRLRSAQRCPEPTCSQWTFPLARCSRVSSRLIYMDNIGILCHHPTTIFRRVCRRMERC